MSPAVMQSTGQFSLQVPQAMQVSKILLGMCEPPQQRLVELFMDNCTNLTRVCKVQNENEFQGAGYYLA